MVTYDTPSIIQPAFSLTNGDAPSVRRANKTLVRIVLAKSQQGERVTQNYGAAEITRNETGWKKGNPRQSSGSCQLGGADGGRSVKRRRGPRAGA